MKNGPDGEDFGAGVFTSKSDFEPQLTPTEFQALFKMSNGNVVPQAQKFFGSYRYRIVCTVCQKSREIEADELAHVHLVAPVSHVYVWCASHKHLKVTPALEVTADMPLPVVEVKSVTRKFKGD